jgi:hypothetical protein
VSGTEGRTVTASAAPGKGRERWTYDLAPAHCLLEAEGAAGAGAEGVGGEEGVD